MAGGEAGAGVQHGFRDRFKADLRAETEYYDSVSSAHVEERLRGGAPADLVIQQFANYHENAASGKAVPLSNDKQITGNVGVFHAARELSRAGWNIMLTVRNAKGADLFAISADERIIHPIQVKAHARKPQDTPLGLQPESYITPWWVFVAFALSPEPVCYLLSLGEIRERMGRDPGTRSRKPESDRLFWLNRRYYTPGSEIEMIEARNAWHRLGQPR